MNLHMNPIPYLHPSPGPDPSGPLPSAKARLPSAIGAALVGHEAKEQRLHQSQADAVDGAEGRHPGQVLHKKGR